MIRWRRLKWLFIFLIGLTAVALLFLPPLSRVYLTPIARQKAEELLQMRVEIAAVELQLLRGGVVVQELKVLHPLRKGESLIEAERVILRLKLLALLLGRPEQLSIRIDRPKMVYVTDRYGNWELRRQVPLFRRGEGEERLPLNVDKITIREGTIEYRDGKTGKTTHLSHLETVVRHVRLPTKRDPLPARFRVKFTIDSQADFKMKGSADFLSPQVSFDAEMKLEGLPLPPFAPYYQSREIPVRITRGFLALGSKATCRRDQLRAPAHATISRLEVEPKRESLKGEAAEAVVEQLKNRRGNLELDFLIAGNIRNPQFRLATNLSEAFAKSLTQGLTRGVSRTVKKVSKGVKKGVKSGVEKLKGLFQ